MRWLLLRCAKLILLRSNPVEAMELAACPALHPLDVVALQIDHLARSEHRPTGVFTSMNRHYRIAAAQIGSAPP